MTQQSKQSMYFGGIPTDPDVRKLREQYPEHSLEAGQEMPYSEVEELIGTKKNTNRFQTVTNRWRNIVTRETSHEIGTTPGEGFRVLTESEKLEKAEAQLRKVGNSIRRGYGLVGRIDSPQLTDEENARRLHVQDACVRLRETKRLSAKNELPQV